MTDEKNTQFDNTSLDDHLGASVEATGIEGAWEGKEVEVKSDPMIDAGSGKPILLRTFEFAISPEAAKHRAPAKQVLFDSHIKEIKDYLWKDGLTAIEEIPPRVVFNKKKMAYAIMVTCQAKTGVMWSERPRTLQDYLT